MRNKLLFSILVVLVSLFMVSPVMAATSYYPGDYERTEVNHYGVNKKEIVIDESNMSNVLDTPFVDSSKKVYDFANVLKPEEIEELRNLIGDFIEKTSMDMVILTIDREYAFDSQNETWAADFYDYNDFGINFSNYSGFVLLRNINPKAPYYYLSCHGVGQKLMPMERIDGVLDFIYDDIHSGNYLVGFKKFISRMNIYYDNGIPDSMYDYKLDEKGFLYLEDENGYRLNYVLIAIIALGLGGLISGIITGVQISKNKMVLVATKANEYLDRQSAIISPRRDDFVSSHTTTHRIESSSSGGGGFGGGGFSSRGSSGLGHSGGGRRG